MRLGRLRLVGQPKPVGRLVLILFSLLSRNRFLRKIMLGSPRSLDKEDIAKWSETRWAESPRHLYAGKRSAAHIRNNSAELAGQLHIAGREGLGDTADPAEAEMKVAAVDSFCGASMEERPAGCGCAAGWVRPQVASAETPPGAATRRRGVAERDRVARLRELGVDALADKPKPCQEDINCAQNMVEEGARANPPYVASPERRLLQRFATPYKLSIKPELSVMLEEEDEKEKNGKPARKTARGQHFKNMQRWTAAKM